MTRVAARGFAIACCFALTTSLAWAGSVTLAWDPNAEPNVAGYKISYGTQPGSRPMTVDVGNRTDWEVNGLVDGQRYYFAVSAYNTSGLESPPSQEVSSLVVKLFLTSSAATRNPTGVPLTWTAIVSQNVAAEYRFWRLSHLTGAWTIVRDYSPANTYTWTPGFGEEGTYTVQAWARQVGSSEDMEAWRGTNPFTVADDGVFVGSLESSVAFPAGTGTTVTWTARASGGPGPLQYKFYRFKQATSTWTMVRDYSTDPTYTWTPGSGEQGRYLFQVWVRRNGSQASYDAWRGTEYVEVANMAPAIGAVFANVSFPSGTGTPITWKANASGGPGPLEYRFWRYSHDTGSWVLAQDYGTASSHTWTPSGAGSYSLQVWVRRAGSAASYEAWAARDFQVANTAPTITALNSNTGLPVGTGTPLTWRTWMTGGPGPFEYKFFLYRHAASSWFVAQDYGSSNTFTWTPLPGDTGDYKLQVWTRRQGSTTTAAWLDSGTFSVADATPSVSAITRDAPAPLTVGMPITWKAKGGGGPRPLEYRFWRHDVTRGTWTIAQDYSWDDTYSWVPSAGEEGSYMLQVWVRRTGSSADWQGWLSSEVFEVRPF